MPLADAPARDTPARSPSPAAPSSSRVRSVSLVGGALLIVAGLALWRAPALNEALFHAVNALGPAGAAAWSSLSVAGLGLSAWIYMSAFAQGRPQRVARLLWILVVGGILIHYIKHGMATPRPLLALGEGHLNVIGEALRTQSMPSGHSAMAFAMLALLLVERRQDAAGADSAAARLSFSLPGRLGWAALALGIALSRVAVGAHWPADALFGAGLGLLFGALAPHAWPVAALTALLARPAGQRLMAIGLVACALSIGATPTLLGALGLAHSTLDKRLATGYPLAEPLQWFLVAIALAGAWRWWRAATAPGGRR